MNRRGFLGAILAAAGVLMPVRTLAEISLELSLATTSLVELVKRDMARRRQLRLETLEDIIAAERFEDQLSGELDFRYDEIRALREEAMTIVRGWAAA